MSTRDAQAQSMSRRQALKSAAVAAAAFAAASSFPLGWTRAANGDAAKPKKVLFFTKSSGFQHPVVARSKDAPDKLALAEQMLVDLGKLHGFDVTVTKDGSVFTPEKLADFDVVAFYTTGDLDKKDKDPSKDSKDGGVPMPPGGFDALLKFVESGKGMIGFHCAADTFNFHMGEHEKTVHPYTKLIGAEFNGHGQQQPSKITAVPGSFPPIKDLKDFELTEEWYRFKNIAPDLHVILVQHTDAMQKDYNKLKPYPETWAREQGKGRVFYTSMGHRDDVWTNPIFQSVLLGGLSWAAGNVEAEAKPNLKEVCPDVDNLRQD